MLDDVIKIQLSITASEAFSQIGVSSWKLLCLSLFMHPGGRKGTNHQNCDNSRNAHIGLC